ncbi:MAG TPA: hypothetical protein IAB22_07630 [Candidatus Merdivicinus intestinavium]|nr:hypothetical protein [Candidatus Merdivicinus intestinavium]
MKSNRLRENDRGMTAMSVVTLVFGMLTLIMGGAYLINHFLTERAYRNKWKDYEDCGWM